MKEYLFQVLRESFWIPEAVWDGGILLLLSFPVIIIVFFNGYKKHKSKGYGLRSWELFPPLQLAAVIAYLIFSFMWLFMVLSSVILYYLR